MDRDAKAGENACGKSKRKSGCPATAGDGSCDTEHVHSLAPWEGAAWEPMWQRAGMVGSACRMGQLDPEQHESWPETPGIYGRTPGTAHSPRATSNTPAFIRPAMLQF